VLTASSDTLVYVTAVYLSAAGVKKSRHTVPAALLVMLLGIVLSCFLVRALGI
jgi:spore maturation protein B